MPFKIIVSRAGDVLDVEAEFAADTKADAYEIAKRERNRAKGRKAVQIEAWTQNADGAWVGRLLDFDWTGSNLSGPVQHTPPASAGDEQPIYSILGSQSHEDVEPDEDSADGLATRLRGALAPLFDGYKFSVYVERSLGMQHVSVDFFRAPKDASDLDTWNSKALIKVKIDAAGSASWRANSAIPEELEAEALRAIGVPQFRKVKGPAARVEAAVAKWFETHQHSLLGVTPPPGGGKKLPFQRPDAPAVIPPAVRALANDVERDTAADRKVSNPLLHTLRVRTVKAIYEFSSQDSEGFVYRSVGGLKRARALRFTADELARMLRGEQPTFAFQGIAAATYYVDFVAMQNAEREAAEAAARRAAFAQREAQKNAAAEQAATAVSDDDPDLNAYIDALAKMQIADAEKEAREAEADGRGRASVFIPTRESIARQARSMGKRFIHAVRTRNLMPIRDLIVQSSNKTSRVFFTKLTGVTLPSTEKASHAALDAWEAAGPAAAPEAPGAPTEAAAPPRSRSPAASTFAEAKAVRDALDSEVTRTGNVLNTFPKGPMGLPPDAVAFSPEYRDATRQFDIAFAKLRDFNSTYVKTFAKELREDRDARRAASAAAASVSAPPEDAPGHFTARGVPTGRVGGDAPTLIDRVSDRLDRFDGLIVKWLADNGFVDYERVGGAKPEGGWTAFLWTKRGRGANGPQFVLRIAAGTDPSALRAKPQFASRDASPPIVVSLLKPVVFSLDETKPEVLFPEDWLLEVVLPKVPGQTERMRTR